MNILGTGGSSALSLDWTYIMTFILLTKEKQYKHVKSWLDKESPGSRRGG